LSCCVHDREHLPYPGKFLEDSCNGLMGGCGRLRSASQRSFFDDLFVSDAHSKRFKYLIGEVADGRMPCLVGARNGHAQSDNEKPDFGTLYHGREAFGDNSKSYRQPQ
jgi:hypothetical protein